MKKFLVVLCVVCMVFSTEAVVFAADNIFVEEYEPNDTMEDATGELYHDNGVRDRYFDLTRKVYKVYGVVSSADKVDWYKIKPQETGESRFKLYVPEGSHYKLRLYDEDGDLMATSKGYKLTEGMREDIKYIYMKSNKFYYLKVEYLSGIPITPYMMWLYIKN